jgi:hypothetical protein
MGMNIGSGIKLNDSIIPLNICSISVITKKKPKIELVVWYFTVSFLKFKAILSTES